MLQYFLSRACIIKLITVVVYGFCNKLERLSLNTRLDWKGLPGTTLQLITVTVKYGHNKFYDTGPQYQKSLLLVLLIVIFNCLSGKYYKLFTAVITPLAAYFSIILTELWRQLRNYGRKKLNNIGQSGEKSFWKFFIQNKTSFKSNRSNF